MIYRIFIDGIDKTGKDLISDYVTRLSNFKYEVKVRGVLSHLIYNEIYDRQIDYGTQEELFADYKNSLYVHLTCNKEDWIVRCKTTNEPLIHYETNRDMFAKYWSDYKKSGNLSLEFNTSEKTPYKIALEIIEFLDNYNEVTYGK